MTEISTAPDTRALEIPMDAWTEPFWAAAEKGALALPRCGACGQFRWPPGPFCPSCQSQQLEWVPAGIGQVFSFTVVREKSGVEGGADRIHIPALIEFPQSGGVRLLAAIVDAAPDDVRIGARVAVKWIKAANAMVPVFYLAPEKT